MADDDDDLNPSDLFGMILAHGNEVKVFTAQRLRELGVAIDPEWTQDILLLSFVGQMHGVNIMHPSGELVPMGINRILLTGESLAILAAIVTIYGRQIVGDTTFTAMLDQQIARVRQVKTEEEQAK